MKSEERREKNPCASAVEGKDNSSAFASQVNTKHYTSNANKGYANTENNNKVNNNHNDTNDKGNRLSGSDSNPAVPLSSPAEHAQPINHDGSDANHVSIDGGNQSYVKQSTDQAASKELNEASSKDLNQGGLHRTNNRNSVASKDSGEGFDAPPTLERSGTERRVGAVTSPSLLRSEGAWGSEVEPSLAKEGRGGSKKTSPSEEESLSEERRVKNEE